MKEAIVTDVSDETSEVVEEIVEEVVELSPREAMIKEIVTENSSEDLDDREVVEEPEEPAEEPEPLEETVTLQVNGEEVVVPRSQVEEAGVRTLQKETAADAKLELAASREQELLLREHELKQMEEDLLVKRDQQEVVPDEVGKAFADALYEDEDLVAKTITTITQSIKALEAQNAIAARKAKDQEAAEFEEIKDYYHQTYNDIANDPDMHSGFNRRLTIIGGKNPSYTPRQVVDEAASEVYERFGQKVEPSPNSEAKRKMPRQPKRAAGRKPAVPEKKPKTRSDVIAEMRGKRGVQAW
jgi:hypothetical protein